MRLVAWRHLPSIPRPGWVILIASLSAFTLCPASAEEAKKKHLFYESFDAAFDGVYASEGYDYTLPFKDNMSEGIVRVTGTQGTGFFPSTVSPIGMAISQYYQTRLVAGMAHTIGAAEVKVFLGVDLIAKYTTPFWADPARGLRAGPTIATSLWWPFLDHAMLNLEASYTTAYSSFSLRAASGVTWPEGVSFGPEFVLSGQASTLRIRGGVHLTGVAWKDISFRLQAGYARNDNGTQGFYAAISSWQRF